jgi:pimeloyl-ACP methyl ester carboxylesterase
VRYLDGPHGPLAHAVVGAGRAVTVVPAWVTSLEVTASGRDPRSSLLARLAERFRLTLDDRAGTGLSRRARCDPSLDAAVAELAAVIEAVGAPTALLGISGAGPAAVALAARRPDLVDALVLIGTYADGPTLFPGALRPHLVGMVRAQWGLGSKLLADLYRPGASPDAARHLARVRRDSADPEVAAACLDATFVALDGGWHLPDAADLDRIVDAVREHLAVPAP